MNSGMPWATKFIDCFDSITIDATILLYKFPSLSTPTYFPDCFCAYFCKYISSNIKIQSREKRRFYKVFLTLLTHQHHLVEFYFKSGKMALEFFQVITCAFGVTHDANIRYIKPLMLNMVVSLAVYKIFFKFFQEFIFSLWWLHFVYF